MYNAEYVKTGLTVLLREGRTKILGIITRVFDSGEKKKIVEEKKKDEKETIHAHTDDHKPKHGSGEKQKPTTTKTEEHPKK